MDKETAEKAGYAVDPYGGGFILCDCSGKRGQQGEACLGEDGHWKDQRVGLMVFASEAAAWAAATPH
jgi:hypothetical protein